MTGRPRLLGRIAALACAWLAHPSQADAADDGSFSVQRFDPAPGPHNFLSVEGGRTEGEWAWSAAMLFDYALDPFVLRSCVSVTNCDDPAAGQAEEIEVVEHLLTWNVMATLTPIPRLQLGLRVPVAFASGEGVDAQTGSVSAGGIRAVGVGDAALEGKVRFFGEPRDPVVLGAALDVKAPLGELTAQGSYLGDEPPIAVRLRGIFDGRFGPILAAANLAGVYRPEGTVGSATLGPELRYGAAVGAQAHEMVIAFAESFGATRFSTAAGTNALEVLAGVHFDPGGDGIRITAGGGTGVLQGVGVPIARALLGVSYTAGATEGQADGDKDGVPDAADECPSQAEDRDGIADEDGCPEDDADFDGILDGADECPEEAEIRNGVEDDDGCPDGIADKDGDAVPDAKDKCPAEAGTVQATAWLGCPDRDNDGVADGADQCPDAAEDTDAYEDTDGCPDPDNDGDGVEDAADECGEEPEVVNGFNDGDGCPDEVADGDGDGIGDDRDACVNLPETLNGEKDDDGCPEFSPKLAEVETGSVALTRALAFDGARIADGAGRKALDALAAGLVNHPEIFLVEVTVTTSQADAALGGKRAEAVVAHLAEKGVAKKRLQTKAVVGDRSGVGFEVMWSTKRPKPGR